MVKEIDVGEMQDMTSDGALLVDVREDDEVADGMIPRAEHMPLSSFTSFQDQIPKDKPIIFYCRSGKRSLKAAQIASQWTEEEVYSLSGGYLGYCEEMDID